MLIADDAPGNIFHNLATTNSVAFTPTLLIAGATALYFYGVWRANRLHPTSRWSTRRSTAFAAAMLATFVALETVIGAYDDVLFWDHMIQHLLLVMVAGALVAMGCPFELLHGATSGKVHDVVDRALSSRVAGLFDQPLVAYVLYAVLIPVSHLTQLYNFSLTNDFAHDNEHLAFLVIGYLFWRPVVGVEKTRHPLSPGLRLGYVLLAVPVDTFTGLALYSTTSEIFPVYTTFHRTWGPSLVSDLHLGGAIMWIGGDLLMGIGLILLALRWSRHDAERATIIDAELDAQRSEEESRAG